MRCASKSEYQKGDEFNLLKLDQMEVEGSHRYWWCDCRCGGKTRLREDKVIKGVVRSCGCLRKRKGADHHLWTGAGLVDGEHFAGIRVQAKYRDIEFDIDAAYIWEVFQKQDGKCAMTGLPLEFKNNPGRPHPNGPVTASLDRIDSSKGYVRDNVWWVHKEVNQMKWDASLPRFIELCRLVTEHHGR